MYEELNQRVSEKDVVVITSLQQAAASWLIERYRCDSRIQIIENGQDLNSDKLLQLCRVTLEQDKKVLLMAQFRSQLPIIKIAALCNEKRKSLINIELMGWDLNRLEPVSYSSF